MLFWKKKSYKITISPDEIFLDSTNIPGFSHERFEGVIEKPFHKSAFYTYGAFLFLLGGVLFGRVFMLEIVRGAELSKRAENNYIHKTFIPAPRGDILDHNGVLIASNEPFEANDQIRYRRVFHNTFAYSQLLGFVGKDESDAKSGIERYYNSILAGVMGERDEELDARGNVISRAPEKSPQKGKDLKLTLDAGLQEKLWSLMNETMNTRGFHGGAGIVFSMKDGAIRALVSVPSYDLNAFTNPSENNKPEVFLNDPRSPLFNRAISGIFAPGSIIKPYYALAALEEGIISPEKTVYSSGAIYVPDPYRPGQSSRFLDWKAHGAVDMRRALAVSSNVYFYTIGGGFGDQKGLGVGKLKEWLQKFKFDEKTGIDLSGEESGFLPDPQWKERARPQNPIWRIGDTYHLSIGQGDLLVSPIAIARGLGIIATRGKVLPLHLYNEKTTSAIEMIPVKDEHFTIIQEGMRAAVQEGGTASALSWVPFPIGGKTGTAEVGSNERVNSWFTGFAPYDQPALGIVIFFESGPRSNLIGATYVASELFRWMIGQGGINGIAH